MTMLEPHQQEPAESLARLAPILPGTYRVLERALAQADAYFASAAEGTTRSPWLHASLTRFQFLANVRAILPRPVDVEDALFTGWQPNDGIRLRYRGIRLRVLKAFGDSLPPACTPRRATEYEQMTILGFPVELLDLALLWSRSAEGLELTLVRPLRPGAWPENSETLWAAPVPHSMVIAAAAAAVQTDVSEEDEADLPIRRAETPAADAPDDDDE